MKPLPTSNTKSKTSACRRFEVALHRFTKSLDEAGRPAEIENELLSLVGRLWPASRCELVGVGTDVRCCPDNSLAANGSAKSSDPFATSVSGVSSSWVEEMPLKWGRSEFGRLRVLGFGPNQPAHRRKRARRLKTLCALAACALQSLSAEQSCPASAKWQSCWETFAAEKQSEESEESDSELYHSSVLHDATLLHAILPFALGQAQRHREPLSLLCIAIDRLHAIRELLGRGTAEGLVQLVGDAIVSLVRKSDIVARLDDDRITVVLPRSSDLGALRVGEMIRERIAEMRWERPGHPGCKITVSAGAAAFPTSADNVLALFEAADAALSQAQARGRNQTAIAPRILDNSETKRPGAEGLS
jgi:diguanylate cyclase (GGDEF)-like protein